MNARECGAFKLLLCSDYIIPIKMLRVKLNTDS